MVKGEVVRLCIEIDGDNHVMSVRVRVGPPAQIFPAASSRPHPASERREVERGAAEEIERFDEATGPWEGR